MTTYQAYDKMQANKHAKCNLSMQACKMQHGQHVKQQKQKEECMPNASQLKHATTCHGPSIQQGTFELTCYNMSISLWPKQCNHTWHATKGKMEQACDNMQDMHATTCKTCMQQHARMVLNQFGQLSNKPKSAAKMLWKWGQVHIQTCMPIGLKTIA